MSNTNDQRFDFLEALHQIARDKGIAVDTLLEALANALVAAYKRMPDAAEEAFVTIDSDSGEIEQAHTVFDWRAALAARSRHEQQEQHEQQEEEEGVARR